MPEMPGHCYDPTLGRTIRTVWHDPSCEACPELSPADSPHLSNYLNRKPVPVEPPPDMTLRKLADKFGKPAFKYDDPTEMF